eukprot:snap_masked-scaffold893_size84343-processed-gene-0.3 protein:Tk04546 transcript:snap_masked-scaffold893_size84343-processed-gene-0.3-mRNA-1 annotation:"sorting nexin-2"
MSLKVRSQSEESEEDLFQSTFANANNAGKVQITGNTENDPTPGLGHHMDPLVMANRVNQMNHGMEKYDPSKEEFQVGARALVVTQEGPKKSVPQTRIVREECYSSPDEADEAGDFFIEVMLSEPHKIGEGMSSFMAYKVTTKTNLRCFNACEITVIRRFSDFLGLHKKLSDKHLPRGRIIPPAPEKSLVGTTRVKMAASGQSNSNGSGDESSSNGSSPSQEEFISRRRFALERFINRVASHPVLCRDSMFIEFLQSNRDLPRATSTSTLSSASVLRLIGRVGDTVNKMTYKMEENDPWFEDKIHQIDSLEAQLKKLYSLTDNLVQCRQDLASATGNFAQSTAMLSSCEEAQTLSRALGHLAKVEEKIEQVHNEQSKADYFYLFELIKDYVGLIGAVKDVLSERSKVFQSWQHAQSMVIKKKEQRSRLEMGGRTDKIPVANEEVMEWEARVEENQASFNKISEVIRVEIELFERYRVKDFKIAIIQYLEALMTCQLQMVRHWEEFIPEVKNILY